MKKRKSVNQEGFDLVKILLEKGLSIVKTAEVSGYSHTTVSRMSAHETLDAYQEYMRVNFKTTGNGKPKTMPTAEKDDTMERIAIALERLADAWEKVPERKGLFSK